MKSLLSVILLTLLWGCRGFAQTHMTVSNIEVENILKGNYDPASYQASAVVMDPAAISSGLVARISPDSLKAHLFAMRGFQNRNTFSDTVSSTRGIGAARRWAYNKFLQYSSVNDNRLKVAYLKFDYTGCSSPMTKHSNIMAVLPGTEPTDNGVIIIEAHFDSRNVDNCDVDGNAFGIGDNATGSAMVMELARVLSKYTFRNTLLFSLNTGEEQGTVGAQALADYVLAQGIPVKAVNNNDVSGGIFCGHTSSAPSCPGYGDIDSIGLRIFSLGGFNSLHKQWARYVKLEYKEQLSSLVPILTDIQIMTPEDRTGRGGDHQPFRENGYTAIRITQANEDGDASNSPGYKDRQHTIRDSLGLDKDHDGIEDSLYVDVDYLARNALVNGNSMAMVALGPDTITLTPKMITSNKVALKLKPAGAPAYRVAVRSLTNDWDSVYTVTRSTDTIAVPYGSNATFYISAAAVDDQQVESQFSTEYSLTTHLVVLALSPDDPAQPGSDDPGEYGIRLLQNKPNPFDLGTMVTILSGTDVFADRTWVSISTMDGRIVQRIKVPLHKGINEVMFDHGFGLTGTYVYSLLIDGLPAQSRTMVFRRP
jgi:hypothetical protein